LRSSESSEVNDSERVYVLMVQATAGPGSAKIPGDRHALAILVRQNSEDEARGAAGDFLKQRSWELPEILQIAVVNPKLNLSKTIEDGLRDAHVHGVSMFVFTDPIPKH
jgi:hypothetical protein